MPQTTRQSNKSTSSAENTRESGDEKSSSHDDDLKHIISELKSLKTSVSKTVKSEDLKSVISSVVKDVLEEHKQEMEKMLREKTEGLLETIETQKTEITNLKIEINSLSKENEQCKTLAKAALAKANWNEQYSRKNNIKIHGVKEVPGEDVKTKTQSLIKENTGVDLEDDDILAIHRIPGRRGYQRPILIKMKNNTTKTKLMKHRSDMKKKSDGTIRLSDDVTQENSELINNLLKNSRIKSAWYFNGHVYGLVEDKKVRFDIFDEIDEKIDNLNYCK